MLADPEGLRFYVWGTNAHASRFSRQGLQRLIQCPPLLKFDTKIWRPSMTPGIHRLRDETRHRQATHTHAPSPQRGERSSCPLPNNLHTKQFFVSGQAACRTTRESQREAAFCIPTCAQRRGCTTRHSPLYVHLRPPTNPPGREPDNSSAAALTRALHVPESGWARRKKELGKRFRAGWLISAY